MSLEGRVFALVEDDAIMGESLVQRLELEGASVSWWRSRSEAVAELSKRQPEAVICDIRLPDGTGEDLYRSLPRSGPRPPFLFVTGFGDVAQAVRLMREGAHDYLTKPFEMEAFLEKLNLIVGPPVTATTAVLGVSASMRQAEDFVRRITRSDAPILVTGETGVGKESATRFLHSVRHAPAGPFIAVNCAALPRDLIESELFGHEKGAFTGAHARHLGFAERAGKGILFLDEIGELDPKLQAKLLRLIESKSFTRVGGEKEIQFLARLVCATNADLEAMVASGSFRQDLYFRINVLSLHMPPLRERREDISWLMDRILGGLTHAMDTPIRGFAAASYAAAEAHPWPGNIRELRNRIERAVALGLSPWIMPEDLFPELSRSGVSPVSGPLGTLEDAREAAERQHILRALQLTGGAVQQAAAVLGISRTTLWEKMKRLDIEG